MDTQEQEFEDAAEIIDEAEEEISEDEELIEDGEEQEDHTADDETDEAGEEPPEDVLVVEFDEEDEPEDSNPVRELRQALREEKKRRRELEAQLEPSVQELGEKPQLSDFDFDADAFEKALMKWHEDKREIDAKNQKVREEQEARQKRFDDRLSSYREAAKALPVKDYQDVEAGLMEVLSPQQQGVIVANAKKPELLVYALGKNEKMAAELAAETDLVAFTFKLAKMEAKMSVTGKVKPKPEGRVSGQSGMPVSGDKKLQQLEAEARKTGDRSKVIAHKRAMKAKAAQK
jgi:hypothetical protein